MAERGGYTSPQNMRLILDVVHYLKNSGFVIDSGRKNGQFIPPEAPIYIRNDSGEQIPPFACVQCTGTVESGGQNYVTVDKPVDVSGTAGGYLFNGIAPIAADAYGIAYDGPFVRMLSDGSAVTCGSDWQPTVSAWTVQPGGGKFSAVGEDDIEDDVIRAFVLGASSSGWIEYVIVSITDATGGHYTGLRVATVTVKGSDNGSLIDTEVEVVDHSGGLFDEPGNMTGYTGWAMWGVYKSLQPSIECDTLTPYHWAAINRVCEPNTGVYATPCGYGE